MTSYNFSQNIPTRGLALLCGVLAVVLLMELVYFLLGKPEGKPATPQKFSQLATSAVIEPLPDIRFYEEVVDKSLFYPNRKPLSPAQNTTFDGSKPSENWSLTGMIRIGDEVYALLSELNTGQTLRLKPGMYLERWQIETLSTDSLVLSNGLERDEMKLQSALPPPTARSKASRNLRDVRNRSRAPNGERGNKRQQSSGETE